MTVYKDVARRSNANQNTADSDHFAVIRTCRDVGPWSAESSTQSQIFYLCVPFMRVPFKHVPLMSWTRNRLTRFHAAVILLALSTMLSIGCQTDQVAQMRIDEMRAEQMAIEDRYAALRNEYEKVRRRLIAQGDPLADQNAGPSALPIIYPPGPAALDEMSGGYYPDQTPDHPFEQELTLPDPTQPLESMPLESQPLESMPEAPAGNDLPSHGRDGSDLNSVLDSAAYSARPRTNPQTVASRTVAPAGAKVSSLGIDLSRSHGFDRDRTPGDEGVQIIVTPLDRQGRMVLASGDFELSLYDYSQAEDVEIGKWKFPRGTINQFVQRRGANATGIPFRVALKNYVLRTPEVMAEVRMTTDQGQQIVVREIIKVKPAENWVQQPPFSLDNLPVPQGTSGLAEFPNEEIVPSFIPADSYVPPVETAEAPSAMPAWSPERR